ncbi:MAG TPA: T9SS type A sorting domain-containing protein [Hymenobacter sp.]|uniref:T9SS type A sorting domain-containing protein n=1 Tax=Hymenobacter sp. TaxID=1898978 RepID=UPI002D7F234B|nr:T9SS type A sorting domain-containing protein [Hymenobacter sp.]HET9502806.1 T9SS type A sorting domain-containing protein [Hymenobacter sp.]
MITALRALGTLLPACLLATASHAQILWQTTMGTAARETSAGFVAVPGGYVNVGQGGYNGGSTRGNQFFVSKVSAAGAVLWQKSASLASRNVRVLEPLGVAATATGEVYATGQCSEQVVQHPASLYSFGVLVKFSPSGDTLWSRVLHGVNRSAYWKIVTTADGGAVVIGSNDADQFVAKFSATGQELWHRSYTYSSTYPGYLENIAQLTTGGFIVTNSPNYGGLAWKYLLLDSQGMLVGTKPARAYGHYFLQTDLTGNVLASTGRLFKLSAAGDTLWSRQYTQYGRGVEVRLAVPVPGTTHYLLAGTRPNSSDQDLSVLLVDQQGTRLRDTLLVRYGGNEYPTGVGVDALGNYLIGGYTDNGPLGRDDQFAVSLRSWSPLLPTRAAGGAGGAAYGLYPNPATGAARLRVASGAGAAYAGAYEVRDLAGRLVQAGGSWPAAGLAVGELAAGLYLLRLRQGEAWLPALRLQRL